LSSRNNSCGDAPNFGRRFASCGSCAPLSHLKRAPGNIPPILSPMYENSASVSWWGCQFLNIFITSPSSTHYSSIQMFIANPCPRGLRAIIAHNMNTYSRFPPINDGQWYVTKIAFGNTPGQTVGNAFIEPCYFCCGVTVACCLSGSCKWGDGGNFLPSFFRFRHHAISCDPQTLDLPAGNLIPAPLGFQRVAAREVTWCYKRTNLFSTSPWG